MPSKHARWLAPSLAVSLCACSLSTDLPKSVEARYAIYSVDGQSPNAQTSFGIGGYKISVPRGSLLLHKDGTVEEILQYVITRPSNTDPIAATDTVFGHYELVEGRYDIRLPNSDGGEAYAGSTNLATDFIELARSWKKNGIVVLIDIAYARSATPDRP